MDDRPLHLKAATKLLFWRLAGALAGQARRKGGRLGAEGFLGPLPPGPLRVPPGARASSTPRRAEGQGARLSPARSHARRAEHGRGGTARQKALEKLVADLLEASVKVCCPEELAGFDGSVGLDATPVPLWSRGPRPAGGPAASDPDGGWYIREGDHREGSGPDGKALRKILLGSRSHGRDDGPAPWCGPGFPQPRPRRVARQAQAKTPGAPGHGYWHRCAPGAGRLVSWEQTGATPSAGPSTSTCPCGRSATRS